MKIVNRLIVLGIIVAGAWFFANQWNKNHKPAVTPEGTEAVEVVTEEPGTENVTEETTPTEEVALEETTPAVEETAPVVEANTEEVAPVVETQPVVETAPVVTTTTPVAQPTVETPAKVYDQVMAARAEAPASEVYVYLYEWEVDMLNDVVPSGDVTFVVHNSGIFTHDFSLDGVTNFGKVKPGYTREFNINLAPGMYDIVSPREQDINNGMWHALVVE